MFVRSTLMKLFCCSMAIVFLSCCEKTTSDPLPAIGVSATAHSFSPSESRWTLYLWNAGDAESELAFTLDKEAPWLACFPNSGTSLGPEDPAYITVTVSRAGLSQGTTDTQVLISAPGVEPVTVTLEINVDGPVSDVDADGLDEPLELFLGVDPEHWDSDGDGLSDGEETLLWDTAPLHPDTDGDGISDGDEIANDGNPLVAEDAPPSYNEIQGAIWKALDLMGGQSDGPSAFAAAAGFLEGNPNVASVYYTEGTEDADPVLCAEMINGVLFVVAESLNAGIMEEKESMAPGDVVAAPKSTLNSGLPQGTHVYLNLYEPGTNDSEASTLADMARQRGHDVEYADWGTNIYGGVEWFKTIANYGLVYVDTHGGFAVDKDYVPGPGEDPNYRPHWHAIQTVDLHNVYQDNTYLANGDFAARRVCLGTTVVDGPEDHDLKVHKSIYYFVTNLFFETYCGAFEQHSLIWFNACKTGRQAPWSAADSLPPLWETFLSKNVGLILGWDWTVTDLGAIRASNYLFSRLLGDNRFEGKTPPLRPYGFTDAWTAMQEDKAYNLDVFYPDGGSLKNKPRLSYVARDYGTLDQEEPILAPTIINVFLHLDESELSLRGNFGDVPGDVFIGDKSLAVKTWDVDEVVVEIGEKDHGLVHVKVGKVESNAVPLTQWSWRITVEGTADPVKGPQVEATATFRGRADIHPRRPDPEAEANRDPHGAPWWTVAAMEEDGLFTYAFSGEFNDGEYRYEHSGGGTVPVTMPGSSKQLGEAYQGTVSMNPDAGTFQANVFATGITHVVRTRLSDNEVTEYDQIISVPMLIDGAMHYYGKIQGGDTSAGDLTIEWEDIEPASAPDEQTPA